MRAELSYLLGAGWRRRWLVLIALALVVGIVEAVGAGLIFVLIRELTDPAGSVDVPLLGDLRSLFPGASQRTLLLYFCAAVGVFFVGRGFVFLLQAYLQARVTHNAGARLSVRLLEQYLRSPLEFHLRRDSSDLIRNVNQVGFELVSTAFVPAIGVASDLLLIAGISVVLFVSSPVATLVALVAVIPLGVILFRFVQPRIARLGREGHDLHGLTLKTIQESLEGFRDIRILGREREFVRRYERARHDLARTFVLRGALMESPRAVIETGAILIVLALVAVGVARGAAPTGTLAVLGLFAYAVLRLIPAVSRLSNNLNSLKFAGAAIEQVTGDLRELERVAKVEIAERPEPLPFEDSLELRSVSYRYPGAEAWALDDVTLRIRRGESVGIIGPTGGGKTTLVDVILGLLPPTRGAVLVDGRDVQDDPGRWHAQVGMVPQSPFLIDDSLRRNIALGEPDEMVDRDALEEAVRLAQLEELVESLPRGIESEIGERGSRLSGGQRQRVAIARALYRRPEVLVFDEGTSALDQRTEASFLGALAALRGRRTLVTVAHRFTTVAMCDWVVVVADGRIVDRGPFDDVMRRNTDLLAATAVGGGRAGDEDG